MNEPPREPEGERILALEEIQAGVFYYGPSDPSQAVYEWPEEVVYTINGHRVVATNDVSYVVDVHRQQDQSTAERDSDALLAEILQENEAAEESRRNQEAIRQVVLGDYSNLRPKYLSRLLDSTPDVFRLRGQGSPFQF